MGDKFRMNFLIVLPAALLTVALLWFSASGGTEVTLHDFELIRVLPYIAVLVLALTGLNAFIVLATGILLSGLVGLFCGIPGADGQIVPYSLLRWGQDIYKGFTGMNEIMVLSMLIGGLYGTQTVADSISTYDITMLTSIAVYLIPTAFLLRKKKLGEVELYFGRDMK